MALHGRDVYDHTTTVVNFDPMTLAIIFPLLTTDISPNLTNALIQCLTTPLSLQTPDRTKYLLWQRPAADAARALVIVRHVRKSIVDESHLDGWSVRRRHISPDLDGGSTASTGSRRAVCNAETNSFSTIYTPTHYRHRRHHIVRAPGHANDNSIYHARI